MALQVPLANSDHLWWRRSFYWYLVSGHVRRLWNQTQTYNGAQSQSNAICKRVHQVIGNIIRTFELQTNYLDEGNPWKGILSATAFAIRCTCHTTLHSSPGRLIFGRDLIFNIKHSANLDVIRQRREKLIRENNKREMQNASHINTVLAIKSCFI